MRANRAKVKFCKQLKILMGHSSPLHRRGIMTMTLITKSVLICTSLITAFSKIQKEEWRPSRIDTCFLFLYRVVIQEIHASLWRILFCEVFNLITYHRTEKIVGWVFWFFFKSLKGLIAYFFPAGNGKKRLVSKKTEGP